MNTIGLIKIWRPEKGNSEKILPVKEHLNTETTNVTVGILHYKNYGMYTLKYNQELYAHGKDHRHQSYGDISRVSPLKLASRIFTYFHDEENKGVYKKSASHAKTSKVVILYRRNVERTRVCRN